MLCYCPLLLYHYIYVFINKKKRKMKRIELKTRKLVRKIFNGISLTAVAFIFQACYGPGPDMYCDVKLTGTVISKTTGLPIKGIQVSVDEVPNFGSTDENGKFVIYATIDGWSYSADARANVHFRDIDNADNGHFADKTIIVETACKDEVKIDVELDEKQ